MFDGFLMVFGSPTIDGLDGRPPPVKQCDGYKPLLQSTIGTADKDISANINTKTNVQIKVQIQKQISGVPRPEEQ